MASRSFRPLAAAFVMVLTAGGQQAPADGATASGRPAAPSSETLAYNAEWRLIRAGNVRLNWTASPSGAAQGWQANLSVESVGLVSRLYKINSEYLSTLNRNLCVESAVLRTNEGSRRRETRVTFDAIRKKASLQDHDLVKNTTASQEIDILACEYDVIGALYQLRGMNLEPGRSTQLPISDGRKHVMARVEAQERETIATEAGVFKTVRYEAFLFNNVLYRRRGRLLLWLTDDERKLPVQVRVRMPFYVGTVTLQLQKSGKS